MSAAAVAFGVAGLLLAVGLLGRWNARRRAEIVDGWPTAPGYVTSVDVIESPSSWSKYMPWVTYNYEVEGQRYEGDRLRLGGRVIFASRDKAWAYLKAFSVGPAQIRYDPRRPSSAVLDPTPQSYVFRVFLVLAAAAGAVGLLLLLPSG